MELNGEFAPKPAPFKVDNNNNNNDDDDVVRADVRGGVRWRKARLGSRLVRSFHGPPGGPRTPAWAPVVSRGC